MMPSFHGSAIDAANAGYAPRPCAHCGNWTWVKHDQTERVFCSRKQCEHTEGVTRAAENPRPTYKDSRDYWGGKEWSIDQADATWSAEDVERIRALGWLEKVAIGNLTIMRVT